MQKNNLLLRYSPWQYTIHELAVLLHNKGTAATEEEHMVSNGIHMYNQREEGTNYTHCGIHETT